MTVRVHPFPSRTRQLSSLVSTILGWKRPGTIDRCQHRKDLLHDVRKVFRFVCGCLRRKMAEIRYRYGAGTESGPLPDGIVRRTGWRAVSREMEPFLRGEEICHPPQFPVPEVRLPIGAVGRMGTGSSTDLTVAGSPRLPSFSERTYGEQLRCRRGCFLFLGRNDLGIPWGASVGCELYVWGKYGIDMAQRGRTARCRMELHDERDGVCSVGRRRRSL